MANTRSMGQNPHTPAIGSLAELDERAREIFRQLVDLYLETGAPVGSRTLSRKGGFNLSPASIRNVMADLEELGLLHAPHTSAGRMPTELGLRFFVDAVMENAELNPQDKAHIDARLEQVDTSAPQEAMLEQISSALSGLAHCAGLVVTPTHNPRIRQIEFVRLEPEKALAIIVGQDGTVENRVFTVPADLPTATLQRAAAFLNDRLSGLSMREMGGRVQKELEILRREIDALAAEAVAQGLATWSGSGDDKRLIVRGRGNLIADAELLSDLERLQRLFEDLEEKRALVELLSMVEQGEGVRIFIGRENPLFSMSGSSLIVAPYGDAEHEVVGVLGVIGPTRLPYARIIPVVDYAARMVSRLLS